VAVKIRLMRVGKKKQPSYRVVVADGRSPRDGRYIEIIGQYGPRQEPSQVQIDDERALAWLREGAQPTEQVQKLLVSTGVWERFRAEHPKAAGRHKPRAHTPKPKPAPAAAAPAEPAAGAGDAAAEAEASES
jgi:small subunit ribosomal protein S16